MKIIEALKKVKHDREKIEDLAHKIREHSARMESHKPVYSDPEKQINEWVQSSFDTQMNINNLLTRIQKTNLITDVTIEIDGRQVTKTIAEWIIRRREGVDQQTMVLSSMTNKGLKPQLIKDDEGNAKMDQVILHFNIEARDQTLSVLREEKSLIDSALEIVNATTDLVD